MNRKNFCNEFSKCLLNLFSDFGKYKTIVSVCDTINFFIIKIDTENPDEHKEINYVDYFFSKNPEMFNELDKEKINTINLIKSNQESIMEKFSIRFDVISSNHLDMSFNNHSIICSDIKNSFVNSNLQTLIDSLEQISNKISPYFKFTWCEYEVEISEDKFNLINFKSDSYYPNSKLMSIFLDNFDLNDLKFDSSFIELSVV
jgi:hypothetical protein